MPLLYEIPLALQQAISSGQAGLVGAIIKDNATGQILGHVQQTGVLQSVLSSVASGAGNSFSPLGMVAVVQNEALRQGVAALQHGMVLMQGLQYATLAVSGLGLGIAIAGHGVTLARLNAISGQLALLDKAVAQVTQDRRDDDLHGLLADLRADVGNVDLLATMNAPRDAATQLHLSLDRAGNRLEEHFRRASDIDGLESMPLEQLDRLWSLAAAIRLCREAAMEALFVADELAAVTQRGEAVIERQLDLLRGLAPDRFARLVARSDADFVTMGDRYQTALARAHILTDGIRGGLHATVAQIGIASTLQAEGLSGTDYVRKLRQEDKAELLYLPVA